MSPADQCLAELAPGPAECHTTCDTQHPARPRHPRSAKVAPRSHRQCRRSDANKHVLEAALAGIGSTRSQGRHSTALDMTLQLAVAASKGTLQTSSRRADTPNRSIITFASGTVGARAEVRPGCPQLTRVEGRLRGQSGGGEGTRGGEGGGERGGKGEGGSLPPPPPPLPFSPRPPLRSPPVLPPVAGCLAARRSAYNALSPTRLSLSRFRRPLPLLCPLLIPLSPSIFLKRRRSSRRGGRGREKEGGE